MPERKRVLLILTDDRELASFAQRELGRAYSVHAAARLRRAESILEEEDVDLLLLDHSLPGGGTAVEARDYLRRKGYELPAIVLTHPGDDRAAVDALRAGFADYVEKSGSLNAEILRSRVGSALQVCELRRENERLVQQIEESQQRLFSVYDSLDDAIMQIDSDCVVKSVNRAGAALANRDPREVVGKVCWQVFDFYPCQKRKKKEQCHIYRTFLEGETISGERKGDSGRSYQYMTFITTHKGNDYTVYRETDVTTTKAVEEKLDQALRAVLPPRRVRKKIVRK